MIRSSLLTLCVFLSLASPTLAASKVIPVSSDNGTTAWLIEDHTLPIVTIKLMVNDSGSASDPKGKEGLAYFASQMLDEGAGDLDSLAFHRALEDDAVHFSAETGEDSLNLSVQSLSQFKDQALHLLALALQQPRFDATATERVRASLQADLQQMEENPSYLASKAWKEHAFPNHPYQHPRLGTAKSLAGITPGDLHAYTEAHFACSPLLIAVVGDMTEAEVKGWLNSSFPARHCDSALPTAPDITIKGADKPFTVSLDVPQTVVLATLPAVKRDDAHYYALTILNHVLGGDTLTSRLGKEIRDKRGLAYYADSQVEELDHTNYIAMHFATRSEKAGAAMDVFRATLADIGAHGITPAELADTKAFLTGSFPLQLDSQSDLASYLISMQHYHLGMDYLEKRNAFINAVTIGEVSDMAKLLLATPLIVTVGKEAPPQ